jgi:hypothetical protein
MNIDSSVTLIPDVNTGVMDTSGFYNSVSFEMISNGINKGTTQYVDGPPSM